MDPGNEKPVEKLPDETEELSSILVAMSLEEVGKSNKPVGKNDVGKSKVNDHGKIEAAEVGKAEEGRKIGKSENEKLVGKTEGQHVVGKCHEGEKSDGNTAGKVDLKGAADVRTIEETIKGKLEEVVAGQSGLPPPKHSTGKSGTEAAADVGKVYEDGKGAHKSGAGKNENHSLGTAGNEAENCRIILAAKSPRDAELISTLTGATELKLPVGAEMLSISEVTDPSLRELFDSREYLENLQASQFGAFVLYSPLIPSTHTLLSQNFHAFPQGTVCIAGAQLQGKGRAGNVWVSPRGCLMFSFTVRMTSGRLLPFLQYVVSLAVIEGIDETCKANGIPAPELRIKWPNDLYAKGLKIGGVLCTSTYSAKAFNIVVGVGLNVGNRLPTTCLDALIQELDPQAGALRQEQLLAAIMSRFEKLNDTFSADGFSPLQGSYYDRWLHSGQTVVLEEKDVKSREVSHIPVTIRGLTPTGYLLASDEQGEQYELHPDGNSFDFLKGLVRSKLST